MANGHGGKRPGAGRKTGSKNRRTAEQEQAVKESGMTPLDYLTSVYRDESRNPNERIDAAKAAAPYVHPKLSNVEFQGRMDVGHEDALDELE